MTAALVVAGRGLPRAVVLALAVGVRVVLEMADPHSPVDGLLHAHVGWLFAVSPAKRERYCRRLMDDPVVMAIERTAVVWLALGLVVPALVDGRRGLLCQGGIVRIAVHNHTMFAVNSICHAFGSQPFATGDESRNNRLIAALAFGEGWHNNHHAFPAAAYHGMGRHPDVTGLVIRALERTGLAWDVHRPSPAAVARRMSRLPAETQRAGDCDTAPAMRT